VGNRKLGKGCGERDSSPVPRSALQRPRAPIGLLGGTLFSHRVAAHLDAVSVMDQAIEDAVGYGGIADLFMPACDG